MRIISKQRVLQNQLKGQSKDTTETCPEKRDTTVMYPGKVMHIIGG